MSITYGMLETRSTAVKSEWWLLGRTSCDDAPATSLQFTYCLADMFSPSTSTCTVASSVVDQVEKRWLRYHNPPDPQSDSRPAFDSAVPPPLFEGPLELSNTTLQRAAPSANRQNRFGVLSGYSMTIDHAGAQYPALFPALVMKMQEVAAWCEEQTAVLEQVSPPWRRPLPHRPVLSPPRSCPHCTQMHPLPPCCFQRISSVS